MQVRAPITLVVVFPLVAVGMSVMGLSTGDGNPALRAHVLARVVVPTAVYRVVPRLLKRSGRTSASASAHSRRHTACKANAA